MLKKINKKKNPTNFDFCKPELIKCFLELVCESEVEFRH